MSRFLLFCLFLVSVYGGESKLCVSFFLEGECPRLKESLESVKGIADCISICDAGSSIEADGGLEILEDFLDECGVFHRTEVLEAGQRERVSSIAAALGVIEEAGLSKEETYILFLAPNEILKRSSAFSMSGLEDDAYSIMAKSVAHYQFDLRLVRAAAADGLRPLFSDPSSYRSPPFVTKLRSLLIEMSDPPPIAPLVESARQHPQSKEALFALAQGYCRRNQFQEAIRWYQARIELGGEGEEAWFSKYKIGECSERLGDWDSAFRWYLEAFQADPKRPEPLVKIATHFRHAGKNEIAYLFAKSGSAIPFPEMKNLYPFFPSYQFEEELSIAAYYTSHRDDGYKAASDLVIKRRVPAFVRDQAYRNLLFYVPRLQAVRYVEIDFDIPLIEGTQQEYRPMNPSIHKTEEGYQVCCRAVSYTQEGAKHFHTDLPNGIFRNRNFLLSYDKEFRLLGQREILEDLPRERIPHFLLEGMEDCRLFAWNGGLWFTATCFDTNPTGSLQIALCKLPGKLQEAGKGPELFVEHLVPLIGPDPNRHEKNWLPFLHNGVFHAIYSYDPFLVYRPDPQTGACETALRYLPAHDFSSFRGSAAPVPFDEGYIAMIHEVVFMPDFTRCYLHRFLYLDANLRVQFLSRPFLFDHAGVEFCCGMARSHSGNELILAIGLEDREARLGIVECQTVRSLLEPLPPSIEFPFEE